MQVNEERKERQLLGVQRWFDSNCEGILDWYPGVGKTFGASLAIKKVDELERSTYLITVPNPELLKQWEDKLEDYFPKHLQARIIIKTKDTLLSENIEYHVGTHIIDELHELHTDDRLKIIDGTLVKSKRTLGLTGSADDKNFWKIKKYLKVIDYISKEEAEEKGFIAKFIEYNLGLDLSLREKEIYDKYSETISKNMPKFNNNLEYANLVLLGGKDKSTGNWYSGPGWAHGLAISKGWRPDLNLSNSEQKMIHDLWNPNVFIGYAKNLINAVRGRKELLCTTNAKYNTTLEIINTSPNIKTILFSESTIFADKIGIILNKANRRTVVYHSQLKTVMATSQKTGKLIKMGKVRLKREAIEKITKGTAEVLSTARSLDKGLDVPDIRRSITTSGSQSWTQYKQRSGRPTRKEAGENDPVLLINLYMKNTQDEIWLNSRQYNLKHKPIEISTVSEITYNPKQNVEFSMLDL